MIAAPRMRDVLNTVVTEPTSPRADPAEPVRLPTKVLLHAPYIPPHYAGLATLLYRLFERIEPNDYCLVTFHPELPPAALEITRELPSLSATAYRFPREWRTFSRTQRTYLLQPVRDLRRFAQEVFHRGRALATVAREERCGAILVASSPELPDLPAALVASRLAGVPLFVHMFDHWRNMYTIPSYRRIANRLEPILVRQATGVICANEVIGEDLARLYGCAWGLVRNATDDEAIFGRHAERAPWPTEDAESRIVFTGALYEANFSAVRDLLAALEAPDLRNVRLHIYSHISKPLLAKHDIRGQLVLHPFVPPSEIYGIQQRAQIVFLPLAFDSRYPEIIRAAATTKLSDYLASGSPMLVHAPADSYPARYVREHDCGLVVDQPSPELVAEAIRRLRDDAALRERLGERARACAVEFSAETARMALVAQLTEGLRRSANWDAVTPRG